MSSIKMKKFVSIKGVIENIRQSVNSPAPVGGSASGGPVKLEQEIIESLNSDQFMAQFTVRHGFPFKPISMAYDPIQVTKQKMVTKLLRLFTLVSCVSFATSNGLVLV
jgi:hypothetical protein